MPIPRKRPIIPGERFDEKIHIDRRLKNRKTITLRDGSRWVDASGKTSPELREQMRTLFWGAPDKKTYMKDLRLHKPEPLSTAVRKLRKMRAEEN